MVNLVRKFASDRSGATAIEYGLIAALVCLGAMSAMFALGGTMSGMYIMIRDTLVSAATGSG